jgi:glutamine synthetase
MRTGMHATEFFNQHPEIEFLDVLLPDLNGLLRGKRIVREQAIKTWTTGVALSASVFGFDVLGEPVEASGLSFDIGDRDYLCFPINHSLSLAMPGYAQVLIEMLDDDKSVYPLSPRSVLTRQLDYLEHNNIYPSVAVELEFYLLKQGNYPTPIDNPKTGYVDINPNTYLVDGLEDYSAFLGDVASAAKLQGLPADTALVESSPGQFEINLHYRTNALQACDEAILLKRLIKQVATQHGYQASFMAKPFEQHCGSGMHIHLGLYDNNANNHLVCDDFLNHTVAGMQQSMHEFMLVFAPHANSYRRMVEGAYVPLAPTWGYNNRTVALRLPLADRLNKRIEHRVSGADANPYLVVAALCAGVAYGLDNKLTPTEPIEGNAYEQVKPSLPTHWLDALRLFKQSSMIHDYFGKSFQDLVFKVKNDELNQYVKKVPNLDYDWYLRTV